jgi:hypothetical protein
MGIYIFYVISRSRAAPLNTGHKLRKEWKRDSAEYPTWGATFRCRPFFASSTGQYRYAGPSERLPFLVRFWASKNEHILNHFGYAIIPESQVTAD